MARTDGICSCGGCGLQGSLQGFAQSLARAPELGGSALVTQLAFPLSRSGVAWHFFVVIAGTVLRADVLTVPDVLEP